MNNFHCLRLLLVTTDLSISSLFSSFIDAEGHRITTVEPGEVLDRLGSDAPYDAVFFDLDRETSGELTLMHTLVKRAGNDALWLLAPLGGGSWNREIERLGIKHLLRKPLLRHDLENMIGVLSQAPKSRCTGPDQVDPLKPEKPGCLLEELAGGRYFLAGCAAMKKIYNTVRLLAPVNVPVLILGESGVGKDIVANLLHKYSLRAQQPYIGVNCAALPSDLLESELFGYEAGAFTGAVKAKPGKFELANQGTLLLDEIGEMSAPMQAKLLHVLQDGHFSRLGARVSTQVNVRVIAATNINIENALADGSFREDLYYRISAFAVNIPPLRDRKEEIPFLVEEMMRRHAATFKMDTLYVPAPLIELMQEYDWPGNLRELSNVLIRMEILQDTESVVKDLSDKVGRKRSKAPNGSGFDGEIKAGVDSMRMIVRNFKEQTESRLIQEALDAAGWNRRHAAAELRISYRALLYKIQQYQLKETGSSLHCHM